MTEITESKKDDQVKTTLRLLKASIASVLFSFIIGYFTNLLYDILNFDISLLKEVHWIIWVYSALLFYSALGVLFERKFKDKALNDFFIIPEWTVLRSFGEQPAAKISYYILILIPLLTYITKLNISELNILIVPLPLNIKLSYFASWFIAISLIIYSISSPKSLKKNPIEKIKTLNVILNNIDDSNIKITNDNDQITIEEDKSFIFLRAVCFYFYIIGITSAIIVLIRGAIIVIGA